THGGELAVALHSEQPRGSAEARNRASSTLQTRNNAHVSWLEPRRLRDPFVIVLILAGFVFGLGPLLGPRQFSDITGFKGTDTLVIRLAGCATLGYGVGLLVGFRGAWREVWMAVAGVLVVNLGP